MLFQMFARLSLDDKVKALQQKIVAVAWLANITLYGAVGEAAMQQAEESGHRVIASISPSDYRHVVRRVLGRELLRKATFGLRQKLPHFSARERVTTAQVRYYGANARRNKPLSHLTTVHEHIRHTSLEGKASRDSWTDYLA